MLRLRHRHARDRRAGRRRPAVQPLPRHRLCSPTRACLHDRPQPPRGRHGVPHRPPHGVSRATPAASRSRPRPLPRVLARRGVQHARGREVAPRARAANARRRARSTAGRSGSASSATTASCRRHQPLGAAPGATTTTTSSSRRRPTATATTSPRTSPTEAIRLGHRAAPGRARPSVLPLLRARAPCTRRTTSPPEWIEPYAGAFDGGWDAVARRGVRRGSSATGVVPAGHRAERPPELDRRVERRCRLDAQRHAGAPEGGVRRLPVAHRRADRPRPRRSSNVLGVLDDTLVMLISDNGASAEGGALGTFNEHRFTEHVPDTVEGNLAWIDELGGIRAYPHYAWGWAWAGNTPLRLWKRYTWLGGTRTPLIVHWPRGIATRGEVRDQFVHAVDLMPTVLDVAGIDAPTRSTASRSSRSTARRSAPRSPTRRRRRHATVQYFEMLGIALDLRRRLEGDDRPRVEGRGRRGATDGGQSRRSPTTSGRCSTSPTTSPRAATSPPTIPTCCADAAGAVVGGGGPQPGVPARRRAHRADRRGRALAQPGADTRGVPARGRPGPRRRGGPPVRRLPAGGRGRRARRRRGRRPRRDG